MTLVLDDSRNFSVPVVSAVTSRTETIIAALQELINGNPFLPLRGTSQWSGTVARRAGATTQYTKFQLRWSVANGTPSGADAHLFVNDVEVSVLSWGAFDISTKTAVVPLQPPPADQTVEYAVRVVYNFQLPPGFRTIVGVTVVLEEEWTGEEPVTPSTVDKTIFDGTDRWAIPASVGGGQDRRAGIDVQWDSNKTQLTPFEFRWEMSQTILAGAEAHLFLNEEEIASFSWGALDTGVKSAVFSFEPQSPGPFNIRVRYNWSGLVAPFSDAFYTIGLTMKAAWLGDPPRITITADEPCADPILCFLRDYWIYLAVGGGVLFTTWLLAPEIQRGIREFRETITGLPERARELPSIIIQTGGELSQAARERIRGR